MNSRGAASDPLRPNAESARANLDVPLFALWSVSPQRKAQVIEDTATDSIPRPLYYVLLLASGGIAAFGLLANSAAVVIGAMLVSPLMAPIFGIALALCRGDLRLLRNALVAEFGGVLLIVGFALILGLLPFALEVTPEMLARTKPTLLDVFVAALAGLAGGLAMVDERTSPALPGVAIATSLTPPLATCGLSLAFGGFEGAWGAFLLFFANVLTILAVAAAIFILAGFVTRAELGTRADFLKRFAAAGIGLLAVAAILSRQLVVTIDDWRLNHSVVTTIEHSIADYPGARLARVIYDRLADGSLNVLATVNTPRSFSPQQVKFLQQAISDRVNRDIHLFVRCAITQDVAAAGSANLLPAVDLDGRFIAAKVTPNVRMTEVAEQILRELASHGQEFDLRDVQLLHLPSGPVIVAALSGARPPAPSQVKFAEEAIRKRLDDMTATLLVRATITSDITSKGRVLLGEAQFAPMAAAERAVQKELETRGKTELEKVANTFVNSIDAAKHGDGWEVRAEVVSARVLQPADVGRVEKRLAALAGTSTTLSVLTPNGLIVGAQGFSTVQRVVEEGLARELAARERRQRGDPSR
ncbi:MAG: putative hydrophobic domain protein [Candidatus Accumulibacter appositus]|uniref:Putative hydrophobic domain protein n=1 Tax=Candidatus Accumulibacter appositus TaxID=1454003 RepID=A0A011PW66_9PROT|nr:DUF389 domain-containing protein [Accumulibacter sp.]EXI81292.1 MAG: putative hydrophobic domain protein [Candidatus Accumulibacter appositus]HRF06142.1 DUF389 domain-containing protein [Accumulibacter sp.]